MPRRRFRDPDPQVRDRNKWDASGQPAIGGLSRIGGAGRGGTSTIVARGGGQPGQVRIEHITLYAEASQTIASGGAGVSWDRIGTAPTELRGFETCADTIGSTGAVVAIPVPITGPGVLAINLKFTDTVTGTVSLVRTRGGIETVLASESGTGIRFLGAPHLPDLRPPDTVTLRVTHATSGTSFSSSTTGYSSSTVGYSSGAVILEWGRLQFTQWELASTTTPRSRYREIVYDDGPLGYWKLDEGSGSTAADSSGNGFHMTYQNGPTLGVVGVMRDGSGATAVEFNVSVTSQHVLGSDWSQFEFAGAAPFTLEAWATRADELGIRNIVAKKRAAGEAAWSLYAEGDGAGGVRFGAKRDDGTTLDTVVPASYDYAADSEHHVVATFDGSTLRVIVDAIEVASGASTASLPGTADAVKIGYIDGPGHSGKLDEVAVYDRVLTTQEIAEHYAVGTQES